MIQNLPKPVLELVLSQLPLSDLANTCLVSKQFQAATKVALRLMVNPLLTRMEKAAENIFLEFKEAQNEKIITETAYETAVTAINKIKGIKTSLNVNSIRSLRSTCQNLADGPISQIAQLFRSLVLIRYPHDPRTREDVTLKFLSQPFQPTLSLLLSYKINVDGILEKLEQE